MTSCAAFGCTNRSTKKIPGITFHKFPKKPDRREAWVKAVSREDWSPSGSSVLCSTHFEPDMFDRSSLVCVRLRENAVPSIFGALPYKKKKGVGLSSSHSSEAAQELSTEIVVEPSLSWSPTPPSECADDSEFILPDLDMNYIKDQEDSSEPGISSETSTSKGTNTHCPCQKRQCLREDEFEDLRNLKREKLQIMKEMLEATKVTALEMQKLNKNYAETKSELKELNSTLKEIFKLKS